MNRGIPLSMSEIRKPYLGASCIFVVGMAQAVEYKEATFPDFCHCPLAKKANQRLTKVTYQFATVLHACLIWN